MRCWARRRRAAATISMALVIFLVFWTEVIRRLMSRLCCHSPRRYALDARPSTAAVDPDVVGLEGRGWPRAAWPRSRRQRSFVSAIVSPDLGVLRLAGSRAVPALKSIDLRHVDVVQIALGGREDDHHLVLHRPRRVLRLVQRRHQPLAAGQGLLGLGVEFRAELGERLQLAELGEVEAQASRPPSSWP